MATEIERTKDITGEDLAQKGFRRKLKGTQPFGDVLLNFFPFFLVCTPRDSLVRVKSARHGASARPFEPGRGRRDACQRHGILRDFYTIRRLSARVIHSAEVERAK